MCAAPRRRHLRLLRLLCCCPQTDRPASSEEGGGVVMGPLTLREYIATLEPYDPWRHGWRGEEPRRVWMPQDAKPPTTRATRRHAHK